MQFRLLNGVIFVALAALVLTGLRVPEVGNDGLSLIQLWLVITAVVHVALRREAEQAFWIGFLGVLTLHLGLGFGLWRRAVPEYQWIGPLSEYLAIRLGGPPRSLLLRNFLFGILWNAAVVATSVLAGFVSRAAYLRLRASSLRAPVSER